MISLWRLTLLCGLFISPSFCLLDPLNPVLGNVQSVVKEPQGLTDKLPVAGQGLTEELEKVKLPPVGPVLGNVLGNVGGLVGSTLNTVGSTVNAVGSTVDTVLSRLEKVLGLKILNSEVLKIKVELGSDGKSINLRVPVGVTAALKLSPLALELTKVKVGLDILLPVSIGIDVNTGISTLALGVCSSDSSTISVSLLNGFLSFQTLALRSVDGLLRKVLPAVVEQQTCPAVQNLGKLLDITVVQGLIGELQLKANVDVPLNVV